MEEHRRMRAEFERLKAKVEQRRQLGIGQTSKDLLTSEEKIQIGRFVLDRICRVDEVRNAFGVSENTVTEWKKKGKDNKRGSQDVDSSRKQKVVGENRGTSQEKFLRPESIEQNDDASDEEPGFHGSDTCRWSCGR